MVKVGNQLKEYYNFPTVLRTCLGGENQMVPLGTSWGASVYKIPRLKDILIRMTSVIGG